MSSPQQSPRFPVWLAPAVLGAVLAAAGVWFVSDPNPKPSAEPAQDVRAPASDGARPYPSSPMTPAGAEAKPTPSPTASDPVRTEAKTTPTPFESPFARPTPPEAQAPDNAGKPTVSSEIAPKETPTPVAKPPEEAATPIGSAGVPPAPGVQVHKEAPPARSEGAPAPAPVTSARPQTETPPTPDDSASAQPRAVNPDSAKPPAQSDGAPPLPPEVRTHEDARNPPAEEGRRSAPRDRAHEDHGRTPVPTAGGSRLVSTRPVRRELPLCPGFAGDPQNLSPRDVLSRYRHGAVR